MIKFLDGPAAGQYLILTRAPIMLRVVFGLRGQWDALDQPGDAPSSDEITYLYMLVGRPGSVHLNLLGGKGEWYKTGEYEAFADAPSSAVLRDNHQYVAWCEANRERLTREWARVPK